MNNAILMSSSSDIDFMIHGIFSYEVFGQTCWITTTHVCALIVMAVLVIFDEQYFRCVWTKAAHRRLWRNTGNGIDYIWLDSCKPVQIPQFKNYLDGYVFSTAAMAADLVPH